MPVQRQRDEFADNYDQLVASTHNGEKPAVRRTASKNAPSKADVFRLLESAYVDGGAGAFSPG